MPFFLFFFRSLQELLHNQENILRKTKKLRIFYDVSAILSEITKEEFFTRSGKLSQNFNSSMRLPLSSRSSFQIKCFKILAERRKHELKGLVTYSTILAKNITQRFLPMINPNQNYIEKRKKSRISPAARKNEVTRKELPKEEFESSYSIDSNPEGKLPSPRKKNKTVYFGGNSHNTYSHQNSVLSQTTKSGAFRKSLFSRKREVKVNIFTDCYGNEHGFDEMRKVINRVIENTYKTDEDEVLNNEEYLRIRVIICI